MKTTRRTRTRIRLAAAAAACAALVAVATPAWAATNTITVGTQADLTVKVAIAVPVSIVCDPQAYVYYSSVSVTVKQANGKQISSASGIVYGDGTMLICDGSTQNNIVVQAMPDAGSGPFHSGAAYATASFSYGGGMGSGDSGSTGSAIKLR